MFRPRLRDFNGRVHDEIRRACILEDQGSHLIVLALMRDTIEKVNADLSSKNDKKNSTAVGAAAAQSSTSSSATEIAAMQRGLKIVESATARERFDVSIAASAASSAPSRNNVSRHRRLRKGREDHVADGDENDDDLDENDPTIMALGGTAEFERFRARQAADESYQEALAFALSCMSKGRNHDSQEGILTSDDLDLLTDCL